MDFRKDRLQIDNITEDLASITSDNSTMCAAFLKKRKQQIPTLSYSYFLQDEYHDDQYETLYGYVRNSIFKQVHSPAPTSTAVTTKQEVYKTGSNVSSKIGDMNCINRLSGVFVTKRKNGSTSSHKPVDFNYVKAGMPFSGKTLTRQDSLKSNVTFKQDFPKGETDVESVERAKQPSTEDVLNAVAKELTKLDKDEKGVSKDSKKNKYAASVPEVNNTELTDIANDVIGGLIDKSEQLLKVKYIQSAVEDITDSPKFLEMSCKLPNEDSVVAFDFAEYVVEKVFSEASQIVEELEIKKREKNPTSENINYNKVTKYLESTEPQQQRGKNIQFLTNASKKFRTKIYINDSSDECDTIDLQSDESSKSEDSQISEIEVLNHRIIRQVPSSAKEIENDTRTYETYIRGDGTKTDNKSGYFECSETSSSDYPPEAEVNDYFSKGDTANSSDANILKNLCVGSNFLIVVPIRNGNIDHLKAELLGNPNFAILGKKKQKKKKYVMKYAHHLGCKFVQGWHNFHAKASLIFIPTRNTKE